MNTQITPLFDDALDTVSGGFNSFLPSTGPVPPNAPPVSRPVWSGPVILPAPTHGSFSAPGLSVLER
jgi:hypothetical protein